MSILCVILHYGPHGYTDDCLCSLRNQAHLDIVVVDNDPLQSYAPPLAYRDDVFLVKSGGNMSFSAANNLGVKACLKPNHKSILILNNDTIVTDGAIELLMDSLKDATVGAVGPCMPYADRPSEIWACGGFVDRFMLKVSGLIPTTQFPYPVDYLPGAAFLCRAELWVEIGGFNENYFLAYEEAEFCLEIQKRGFSVIAEPRAIILHKVGISDTLKIDYFYNSTRNKILFSQYFFGNFIGFLYAIPISFFYTRSRSAKVFFVKVQVWLEAFFDSFSGRDLNFAALERIKKKYLL